MTTLTCFKLECSSLLLYSKGSKNDEIKWECKEEGHVVWTEDHMGTKDFSTKCSVKSWSQNSYLPRCYPSMLIILEPESTVTN